ncbi:TadE family protein (plasmid) [Pseudarthrobacter chlorophenolicus A6]|uniref:TadE family protein n=1 Tax=Pseudarthrobacter chlorophenolicus (strain ATCC 700700 / DSM 12829 / CIP 107037 / JCM 12360 / KCTC 9906 / NCIMB 13794 / A6) TaxID=452863 RepID=B8HIZ4_PSECP|nr:TadE/TadG family type IV pilus assembly protein [Pseudarthrobacter chlorophenolicus]ACL42391.1 TadE family protein [Pseudarthrobacter chlorophenolicus A6]SDQ17496.1 TadE-like protein [Pseudarthrobacter chlorophenolicus]
MKHLRSERGSVAVEFALILPILIAVLLGIMEFGRAYNAQITVTAAAREGARVMSIQGSPALAKTAVQAASPALNPQLSTGQIQVSPTTCTAGANVTVTVTYRLNFITGFLADGVDLKGKGVMRCGG